MGPITAIIRLPRSVTLGGEPVRVGEARLRDLAALQLVLDERVPDPLDGLDGSDSALLAAWLRLERGSAVYGEPSGNAFYGTAAGVCAFLWIALARHNPDLTPDRLAELACRSSGHEYATIQRIFHGREAAKTIERLLLGEGASDPRGVPITWTRAIAEVHRETKMPFAAIYDLTLTEWRAVRRGGEDEPGWAPPSREAAERAQELFERLQVMRQDEGHLTGLC